MLKRFQDDDSAAAIRWEEMGAGAPTLIALARICSSAMASAAQLNGDLSREAKTILYAAKDRGIIDVTGNNRGFDAPARLLAVHVEVDDETSLIFKRREQPELTVRFLEGFRQLCAAGLVMHHIFRDFTLTAAGFELARTIDESEVADLLEQAVKSNVNEY